MVDVVCDFFDSWLCLGLCLAWHIRWLHHKAALNNRVAIPPSLVSVFFADFELLVACEERAAICSNLLANLWLVGDALSVHYHLTWFNARDDHLRARWDRAAVWVGQLEAHIAPGIRVGQHVDAHAQGDLRRVTAAYQNVAAQPLWCRAGGWVGKNNELSPFLRVDAGQRVG